MNFGTKRSSDKWIIIGGLGVFLASGIIGTAMAPDTDPTHTAAIVRPEPVLPDPIRWPTVLPAPSVDLSKVFATTTTISGTIDGQEVQLEITVPWGPAEWAIVND